MLVWGLKFGVGELYFLQLLFYTNYTNCTNEPDRMEIFFFSPDRSGKPGSRSDRVGRGLVTKSGRTHSDEAK